MTTLLDYILKSRFWQRIVMTSPLNLQRLRNSPKIHQIELNRTNYRKQQQRTAKEVEVMTLTAKVYC
jgi:hypothetical protein